MNEIIRLAFAQKQRVEAERLTLEAFRVFLDTIENLKAVSVNYNAIRAEIARMAGRN